MFAALESSTDVLDCDSTDAFQVLSEMCTFIRSSESLPERIHICAAGQCDRAHPEVHQNFNSHGTRTTKCMDPWLPRDATVSLYYWLSTF